MNKYVHLKNKAIEFRNKGMALDDIVNHLAMSRTTVYYWIKDISISRTEKQQKQVIKAARAQRTKYKTMRDDAYKQGIDEANDMLKDRDMRDFVILYIGEGSRRDLGTIAVANSNASVIKFVQTMFFKMTDKDLNYLIQYHVDQDLDKLKIFWSKVLKIDKEKIKLQRKSNSGKMAKRQWRSEYGVLTIRFYDTYLKCRLNAWMDTLRNEWLIDE